MFTGIIETLGEIKSLRTEGENLHITIKSTITNELKIDQSVAHNGVCLTVVAIDGNKYTVTAIKETLAKTNLSTWKTGDTINLERAMKMNARLDGHIVQGHVDEIGICTAISEVDGSWYFTFVYNSAQGNVTIEKGSITINGVSLTVVNSKEAEFSVAIIPYTYTHTNFSSFEVGTKVNLEFDVIGKYVKRLIGLSG
ncbi:MAG: riboflavin synthase [Flavobacteriaceae bacterium]|nr:riboflavin synthase [Flavobacteriaceae bacterium]